MSTMLRNLLVLIFLCVFTLTESDNVKETISTDVVVSGASSSGVMAAIAAARLGSNVVLLSSALEHGHTGGMLTVMGCTDVGNASVIGGLAREFYQRVHAAYKRTPSTQANVTYSFEPKIASEVLQTWLQEGDIAARIHLIKNVTLLGCTKGNGKSVSHLDVTYSGKNAKVNASVFIDASMEGDLLSLCGIKTTYGREGREEYNESLAGRLPEPNPYEAAHTQFWFNVSGVKEGKELIPGVSPNPTNEVGEGDNHVQSYTFRAVLTNDTKNMIPLTEPAGYNESDWILAQRFVSGYIERIPNATLRNFVNLFPLPNNKFDVCNYGPVSTDAKTLSFKWPTGSTTTRDVLFKEHKNYQLGFFWFMASNAVVPKHIRDEMLSFGLPRDEFGTWNNWPPILYVREAQRMVGDFVFIQAHREGANMTTLQERAIAMGSYAIDSLSNQRFINSNNGNNIVAEGGMVYNPVSLPKLFWIPYDVMLPKPEDSVNVLASMAVSASHVNRIVCLYHNHVCMVCV
eukprot:m.45597 g.45597  ORF g.45597 m.45597 type:complete len:515 (-) comp10273_c0_seq2:383-1927(-)